MEVSHHVTEALPDRVPSEVPTPNIWSQHFGCQPVGEGAMRRPAGGQETSGGRTQRADARINRSRILDVAEDVFGKGGKSASTEEVARLAGVGIATVFRHFPTKATLLEAVLVRRFDRLREQAEALLNATDPGKAFLEFFSHLVADAATKIAIPEALLEAGG